MVLASHTVGPGAGLFGTPAAGAQTLVALVFILAGLAVVAWWLRPKAESRACGLRSPRPERVRYPVGPPPVLLRMLPGSADQTPFWLPEGMSQVVQRAWDALDPAIQHGLRNVTIEISLESPTERGAHGELRWLRGQFIWFAGSKTIRLFWPMLCATTEEDIQRVFWHEAAHAAGLSHADLEPYKI